MKNFLLICLFAFSAQVSAKPIVVFDIDNTLCWSTQDEDKAVEAYENYPDHIIISDLTSHPGWTYVFLPEIDSLFNYLLSKGCEIHFFSAGVKERNEELIPVFLDQIYPASELRELQEAGNFKIFSRKHMAPKLIATDAEVNDALQQNNGDLISAIREYQSKPVKSLRRIFPDKDISDMILIDDFPQNCEMLKFFKDKDGTLDVVTDDAEQPQLIGKDSDNYIEALVEEHIDQNRDEIYNNMAYYAGVLFKAFEVMDEVECDFRRGLSWALSQLRLKNTFRMSHSDFIRLGWEQLNSLGDDDSEEYGASNNSSRSSKKQKKSQ